MIYDDGHGCYVFHFDSMLDVPCIADSWYSTMDEARAVCSIDYDISASDWSQIPDPEPGYQDDIIGAER